MYSRNAEENGLNNSRNFLISCSICQEEFEIRVHEIPKVHRIQKCKCYYCIKCLEQYITTEIMSRKQEITCPDPLCRNKGIILFQEIKKLVPLTTLKKYEEFLLSYKVAQDDNLTWCPAPNCNTICSKYSKIFFFGNPSFMSCPTCQKDFCFDCSRYWHPNSTCEENTRKFLQCSLINNQNTKQCPKCKIPIEKNGGCKWIKCKQCKRTFCWDCLFISKKNFSITFLDEIVQYVPFLDRVVNFLNYVPLDKCKCSWKWDDSLHIILLLHIIIFHLILANSFFAFLIAKLISYLMSIIPEGNSAIFGTFLKLTCDHILLPLFVIIFNLGVLYKLWKNIAPIHDPSPPLGD